MDDSTQSNCFGVEDIQAQRKPRTAVGARTVQEPTAMGLVTTAVLDDTCGNFTQIAHLNDPVASAQ